MAKTEGFAKVVVCDAGPLIHLDELDCLDLLGDSRCRRRTLNRIEIGVGDTLPFRPNPLPHT